jgi:TatA/E family protein of Tat protein translocase
MGLIDPIHLLLVAIVALIVIGPRRLPELARALGRATHEFREAMEEGSKQPAHEEVRAEAPDAAAHTHEHPHG